MHNKSDLSVVNNFKFRWGVSTEQQMELGNSVKHFQCMVCNRIADNQKYSSKGRLFILKLESRLF